MKKLVLIIFLVLLLAGVGTVLAHHEDGSPNIPKESNIAWIDDFILFLNENRNFVLLFHILGIVLGLGAATLSNLFFFKFLKDWRISEKEAKVLHTFSKVIWVGLVILILSGLGLYLPHWDQLLKLPMFLTKMMVVGVILINGILLNTLISPNLTKIFSLPRLRRLAFVLGPISVVSWYSAFILGMFRSVSFSFIYIFGTYLILLAVAITAGQIVERVLARRAKN